MAGNQQGFKLTKQQRKSGTTVLAQVWNPVTKRYAWSKSFASWKMGSLREAERAALAWAKAQSAKARAGVAEAGRGAGCATVEALLAYLEDRARRGGNRTHLANVRRRIGSLVRWCPNLAAPDAPRQLHLWWRAFCDEPQQIGYKPGFTGERHDRGLPKSIRTCNNALMDAKAFARWCWKARSITGLTVPVDVDWIEPLRAEHRVKAQFTLEELGKGLRLREHPFRLRWALYAYLGARLREALNLRWDDISGGHVLLRGKGRKERLVPLQGELAALLRLFRRSGGDHEGWLFPPAVRSDDGGNLSRRFDAFLRAAKIPKEGRSTHSLRHCYAGLMTATGEPTALLQAYMGHSQSDMTMHYAQAAARYRQSVAGWPRGELPILRETCEQSRLALPSR